MNSAYEDTLTLADLIYDIVADCSDNVPTRYLVNDACVLSGKPLVSASALRMEGQVRCKSALFLFSPPSHQCGQSAWDLPYDLRVCVCAVDCI